jgi:transposase
VRYTRQLEKLVEQLSRVMTLLDVAEFTALNWDTVKDIVKRRLRRDYGRIDLKGVRYLSIDEIYVGKRRGYYTLVMDIESGRILWVSQGRGKAGLQLPIDALRQVLRAGVNEGVSTEPRPREAARDRLADAAQSGPVHPQGNQTAAHAASQVKPAR